MKDTEALDKLRECLDSWDEETLACLSAALIIGNGGTLAEDELYRQASVVRERLLEARLTLAWWDAVRMGELVLAVDDAGEVAIKPYPGISVDAIRAAKGRPAP